MDTASIINAQISTKTLDTRITGPGNIPFSGWITRISVFNDNRVLCQGGLKAQQAKKKDNPINGAQNKGSEHLGSFSA